MGFDRRAGSSATYAMTSKLLSASFSVVLLTIATITSTTKALPIGTRLNERAAVEEVQLLSHRYPGALMLLAQANIMEDTLLYDAIRINPTDVSFLIECMYILYMSHTAALYVYVYKCAHIIRNNSYITLMHTLATAMQQMH